MIEIRADRRAETTRPILRAYHSDQGGQAGYAIPIEHPAYLVRLSGALAQRVADQRAAHLALSTQRT